MSLMQLRIEPVVLKVVWNSSGLNVGYHYYDQPSETGQLTLISTSREKYPSAEDRKKQI